MTPTLLPSWLRRHLFLVVLAMCAVGDASSAEVRWQKGKFTYVAQGKPIKDFLREFAASQGLSIVVSKEVEGSVSGKFDLLPESLLALMSANFGFIWYYDGSVLHITPASDIQTEVIRLQGMSTDQFRAALARLDIPDPRYPITFDARQSTALVSGPKRYVELVLQTARAVSQNQADTSEVRIVPLRYAWAADFTYSQGGQQRVVPGVASVLSQLYGSGRRLGSVSVNDRGRSTLDKLRGLGLASNPSSAGKAETAAPAANGEGDASAPAVAAATPGLPQFIADGRMNAVLVRDVPDRMTAHEAAIRALDVKPGILEIEVRIIEVNSDEAESLGIDWRARSGRVDLQVGKPGLPTLSWGTALSDQAPAIGPGGALAVTPSPSAVLTTVLGDAGRYLIARVNALAQDGKANLLSSPKLMTLDNVEAVLENLNTFFVRVQGNLDVDLFNVSTGTSLRVTPLIVQEGPNRLVKLAIRIEDGSLTAQSVDGVPIIRRSTISTQSIIGDGQALLIGGYAQESETENNSGVPVLSKLPVAGWLFKHNEKRKSRVERLFLLTPKVIPGPT